MFHGPGVCVVIVPFACGCLLFDVVNCPVSDTGYSRQSVPQVRRMVRTALPFQHNGQLFASEPIPLVIREQVSGFDRFIQFADLRATLDFDVFFHTVFA